MAEVGDLVERLRAYGGDDRRDYRHLAADALSALLSERDEARLQQKAWADKWDHAESQCDELREALRPFAKVFRFSKEVDGEIATMQISALTYADFSRAARLLKG